MYNYWYGYQMTSPFEMEARFSNDDTLSFVGKIHEEPSEESLEKLEKLQVIIDQLPTKEADFVDLHFFKGKKQTDIAEIFEVSQPTVCYRLQRAKERITFLLNLPKISEEELEQRISEVLTDPLDVKIMILMNRTSCQSAVAKKLNVSQGLVRHRFKRAIKRMKKRGDMEECVTLFTMIDNNLNKKREVKRSKKADEISYFLY